jgi:hypothetical protein
MALSTGFIGSPDYFGSLGTGEYIPFGFAIPIGTVSCPFPGKEFENCFDLAFDANAGYTHSDVDLHRHAHHYWDYNAGMTWALPFNFKLDFRFVGTDQTTCRRTSAATASSSARSTPSEQGCWLGSGPHTADPHQPGGGSRTARLSEATKNHKEHE